MEDGLESKNVLFVSYFYPPAAGKGLPAVQRSVKFIRHLNIKKAHVLTLRPELYPGFLEKGKTTDLPVNNESVYRTGIFDVMGGLNEILRSFGKKAADEGNETGSAAMSCKAGRRSVWGRVFQKFKDAVSGVLTYPDFGSPWIIPAVFRGVKIISQNKVDIIFTTGMPWSSLLVGYFLKLFTGKKLVADFRDPWVENPYIEKHRFEKMVDIFWEKRVVNMADLIVANTEALGRQFEKRYDNINGKVMVLPNGYDESDFINIPKIKRSEEKLTISHTGFLYKNRDPKPLLDAFEIIRKRYPELFPALTCCQIGDMDLGYDLHEYCRGKGLGGSIKLVGQMEYKKCLGHMAASDILLLIQPDTRTQIPSKIYEYIYINKPILAITDRKGALGELVCRYELGETFEPDEVEAIAEYLVKLLRDKNGRYTTGDATLNRNRDIFDICRIVGDFEIRLSELL